MFTLLARKKPVQCLPTAAISRAMFNTEQKFRVKNVKGKTDVRKQTYIPYISHQVIINVPSYHPALIQVCGLFEKTR